MTCYISGSIKNDPNYRTKFSKAEADLAEHGYHPINPCTIADDLRKTLGREFTYEEVMKEDFKALLNCSMIVMLPDWIYSKGAKMEQELASWSGIKVRTMQDILEESMIMKLK
jgi:hypothetical protein